MLFDRIPGLYGSGIIPRRFKEIRETVKNTIMKTFFDETYLKNYISTKLNSFISMINFEEKIKKVLESPAVSQIIDQKLEELKDRPEGLMLTMMGIDPSSLKPLITPFVLGMGSDIAPLLLSTFDITKTFDISRVRKELDSLMTEKLKELTPQVVKKLMEDVMRKHLGWLIVWGNVFGGIIGVISYASGYK
ncbi:hypothetical protein M0811_11766 [Anaeramoeba ignava]|uniref:DUF445 domain-containing protein n=1 Tax=Anaeramoeba ignava TaxID=1746090 RepID=A0A9Q0R7A5_ANAIG|nr:hypothetical protein M0811_11766 [Anaeramoeba ignava]